VFNGSYTVKQELNNDMNYQFFAYNLQGGQYKLIVEKDLGSVCDFLYSEGHRHIYEDFMSHTEPSVPFKTCPYPQTQHNVKNYLLKGVNEMIPPYVPGSEKWKVEAEIRLNGKILGGAVFYATLINSDNIGTLIG
jgi:surfactin synthase thioesterase subunit